MQNWAAKKRMNGRYLTRLWVGSALLIGVATADESLLTTQGEDGELAGWKCFLEGAGTPAGAVWRLEGDGLLVCKGTPNGYLYTGKSYADFVLALEWRWPPGGKAGKGGVLIRMSGENQIWPCSLEAQLNAGAAGDFWALGGFDIGGPQERVKVVPHPRFGLLKNLPRLRGTEKPVGEWNAMEVLAKGGVVIIRLNGEEVNRTEAAASTPGPILLTSEGTEIQFRNIRIRAAD